MLRSVARLALEARSSLKTPHGLSSRIVSVRAFSSRSDLVKKLRDERDEEEIPTLSKAPTGWKLTEKHGFKDIILSKDMPSPFRSVKLQILAGEVEEDEFDDHDDDEDIDDDDDEAEGDGKIRFTVSLFRQEEASTEPLVFTCISSKASKAQIIDASLADSKVISSSSEKAKDAGDSDGLEDETLYEGPGFNDLDPDLIASFENFLERDVGVDGDLLKYLYDLSFDKEQCEYVRWLKRVEEFLE